MGKVVFWLVVAFAVLLVVRIAGAKQAAKRRQDRQAARQPEDLRHAGQQSEDMIRCVRCGTYVPRSQAKPGPEGLNCGDPACRGR